MANIQQHSPSTEHRLVVNETVKGYTGKQSVSVRNSGAGNRYPFHGEEPGSKN